MGSLFAFLFSDTTRGWLQLFEIGRGHMAVIIKPPPEGGLPQSYSSLAAEFMADSYTLQINGDGEEPELVPNLEHVRPQNISVVLKLCIQLL